MSTDDGSPGDVVLLRLHTGEEVTVQADRQAWVCAEAVDNYYAGYGEVAFPGGVRYVLTFYDSRGHRYLAIRLDKNPVAWPRMMT